MNTYTYWMGWRKYFRVFVLGIQEEMEYRVNYLFETFIGLVTFLVLYFLWHSVFQSNHGHPIAGMSFQEMLTYVLLAKFWDWVIDPTTEIDNALPEDIRHGGLNRFITRPLNDRFYRFSRYFAHKILHAVLRIGPTAILIIFLPQLFTLKPTLIWWYLPLAGLLALILQFSFSYMVAMVAFWWLEIWGVLFLKRIIVSFLAGSWMPLSLFPESIARFVNLFPFHYMIFFPIQIAQGKLTQTAICSGLWKQLGWIIIFTILGSVIWKRGMKEYSAAGI